MNDFKPVFIQGKLLFTKIFAAATFALLKKQIVIRQSFLFFFRKIVGI